MTRLRVSHLRVPRNRISILTPAAARVFVQWLFFVRDSTEMGSAGPVATADRRKPFTAQR